MKSLQADPLAPLVESDLGGTRWAIEGIFPYHDADGVHVYDIVRFAAPPVTRVDGPRQPDGPHRCGSCATVFTFRSTVPCGMLVERGENAHGEPYHLIVPLCPECAH